MAIAAKRHLGVSIPFIGATALTVGQLAYVSREKAQRTQVALASAAAGQLALAEWVKLCGLLNHLVCVLLMPYYCMYGVYVGLDAARACRLGPDELVTPDARCVKALTRWSDALARTSGTTALASVYPSRRPATTGVLHVMHSDAALKGTKYPAICGNLYSNIYVLPLTAAWRTLPIVCTEFAGGIINIMLFAPMLHGAPGLLVLDALVVPIIVAGRASSPLMRFMHEYLVSMPEYALVADTLLVAQEYGPYNPIADAGSRGKAEELDSLMAHMGLVPNRVTVPLRAHDMLDEAARIWGSMGERARASHLQLERAGTAAQPQLGATATSLGPHNIGMYGPPIAHPGAGLACGGFIGCSLHLAFAAPSPSTPPLLPAAGGASATNADNPASCLLAAEAVEQQHGAARVRDAATAASQALAAAAAASLAAPPPLLASVLSPGAAPPGAPGEAALLLQLAAPTLAPAAPVLALRAPAPPSVRGPARRTRPCNRCVGCAVPDCGQCIFCRDKPAFGGPNRLRKRCTARVCARAAAAAELPAASAPPSPPSPSAVTAAPAAPHSIAQPALLTVVPHAPPAAAHVRLVRGAAVAASVRVNLVLVAETRGERQDERAHEAASRAHRLACPRRRRRCRGAPCTGSRRCAARRYP